MAKRKFRILRIGGWIIAGIISLILLTTLVFYIGRDYFLKKAVNYLNEQQPGEVRMGQMNLIPFLNFPDVTLQLHSVQYYENGLNAGTTDQEPILSMNEIGVTLDVVQLMKGGIMVSEARLKDGFLHYIVYSDSVSNLEHALGIRFSEQKEKETDEETSPVAIDLDHIELDHVFGSMENRVSDDYVSLNVNRFESSFSYLLGEIMAALEVDIDINKVKYQTINEQIDKNLLLKGSIILDPEAHIMKVDPSSLSVSGLEFETWGSLDFRAPLRVDFAYNATNEGLELLNFLFRGILDLDQIEQIGGGNIHLNGTVQGNLTKDELPVVRMNGEAEELGFRIRSIGKDVTGISFHMFATNGGKSDLSEGFLHVQEFSAKFPEGDINANLTASNINEPELNIEVDCNVDLEGLDEMLHKKFLTDLSGALSIHGQISGSVDRQTGGFLNDSGSMRASLADVSFVINQDSLTRDSLKSISGEFLMHDSIIGAEHLAMELNRNRIDLGFTIENLLHYFLGYNRDVSADLTLSSELLHPATLISDTAVSGMLGEVLTGLYFRGGVMLHKNDLDDLIELDSLPEVEIHLDSFAVSMPELAVISNVRASVGFGPDSIILHSLDGTIGESSMALSGAVRNYAALTRPDSGETVQLDFNISSPMIRAVDLLTIDSVFLLPQTYLEESLNDFRLSGSLEASAAGLAYDTVPMDVGLDIKDLGWRFGDYPLSINNFLVQVRREGDLLFIDNLQGSIGDNNLRLSAFLGNFTDTLMENIYGNFELYSDLIDMNQILSYQELFINDGEPELDSAVPSEPVRLDEMEFPQIDFLVNIGELRYENHTINDINGQFRSSREKIIYLDRLESSPEGKGTIEFNGQLNLSRPDQYSMMAELNLEGIDIGDLNLELQDGDTIMAVNDHFHGMIDAKGLAEIILTPELKVDIPSTTAAFNIKVTDGALINFTPLQAAGKYLDSKDLNNVRFATLRNSFTLLDSRINIPIMNVESTVGQLLIQGEQGLDMSYLYLVHVPTKLARQAARSAMSEGSKDDGEDQVSQMKRGDFLMITVWSNGAESDFKLGDKRDKFQ